jgi:hypothetical protein
MSVDPACPGTLDEPALVPDSRISILAGDKVSAADPDHGVEVHGIERTEAEAALEMLYRDVRLPEILSQPTTAIPGPGRVRIKSQCLFQNPLGDIEITNDRLRGSEDSQNCGIIGRAGTGLLRQPQRFGSLKCRIGGPIINTLLGVAPRCQSQRQRITRI